MKFITTKHASDCAVYSGPASMAGPCDCGSDYVALRADLKAVAVALESIMMATEGEKRIAYNLAEEALARDGVRAALEGVKDEI